MTTRFRDQKRIAEKGLFHAYFRNPCELHIAPNKGYGKRLVSCLFPHLPAPPEGLRKKATYYVREEKVLQVALFPSSHSSTKSQHAFAPRKSGTTVMDQITLTLPYPPTVNHYWQTRVLRRGARYVPQVYVSEDGRRYQQVVAKHLNGVPMFAGRLRVQILAQPPDGRARDLDNVLKCLLDSLTKAGVWHDDQQIDSLLIVRGEPIAGGAVIVLVETSQQETEE